MLNRRILLSTLTLMLAASTLSKAFANDPYLFIDPSELERDFQFFAPFDMSDYNGGRSTNTGFYLEYNRLYYAVSRPKTANNPGNRNLADKTWGDRYDIGYMLDDNHGWLMSFVHLNGPDGPIVSDGIYHAGTPGVPATPGRPANPGDPNANPAILPTPAVPPVAEIPAIPAGPRAINLGLNMGSMRGIELNKLYRLDPLHGGSVVEPFYGVRYSRIVDSTSNYSVNDIIGGQLGFRWSTRHGRWVISNETRAWAGYNFQHMLDQTSNEVVVTGDIRLQAAFNISRDISLTTSFDIQHYGMGIARGNLNNTNENYTMFGVGFGAVYNR